MKDIPLIIGLYGHKQSGKSTMAHCLQQMREWSEDLVVRSFAEPLKILVNSLLIPSDWDVNSLDWFDSEENKNLTLPCGITVRKALQIIGADWFRQLDKNVWVNYFVKTLPTRGIVVVPDVRFPNEWQLINDMGGITVQLLRNPCMLDNHPSEGALDKVPNEAWSWVLDNRDMTIAEQDAATREIFTPIFQEFDDEYRHSYRQSR